MPPRKTMNAGRRNPGKQLPGNWKLKFLQALANGVGVAQAADQAGVGASTVRLYRRREPAFDRCCQDLIKPKERSLAEEKGHA